jgi:hypothetical protein
MEKHVLKKLFKAAGIALLIAYCQLAAAQMTVSESPPVS